MNPASNESERTHILPGITLDSRGEAHVAPELSNVLFDLAVAVDDRSRHPVDVEHVLAALVVLAKQRKLASDQFIRADDEQLIAWVMAITQQLFEQFDGRLGADD